MYNTYYLLVFIFCMNAKTKQIHDILLHIAEDYGFSLSSRYKYIQVY